MTATIPAAQLEELVYSNQGPRVVALGGGHGLAITLKAVQSYASEITAVVSVADDGGSSGRLTSGLGVAPPGDVRRCLLALTPDHTLWSEVFGYRFEGGDIEDHSLGNLLLAALTDITGDFVSAVEAAGRMLKTVGRVIPVADQAAVLRAVVQGNQVEGQAEITKARGIEHLAVGPADITAHPAALEAIADADQLILGPGSLYTSIMSVMLIPGVREAWEASGARKVFVLNLIGQDGETMGMSGRQHLEALASVAGIDGPGTVLANSQPVMLPRGFEQVGLTAEEGFEVGWMPVHADLVEELGDWPAHDQVKLGSALARLL